MTEQERTLIAGCVKGDKTAWDAFVEQYSNLVYHTIRKTASLYDVEPRDEAVDDLFQEFFHSLLRDNCKKLRQFRGDKGCSLASWIRLIVVRQAIDFLRKHSLPTAEVSDNIPSPDQDAPNALTAREIDDALAAALTTLSHRDRLLIELYFSREFAAEKVASMLKTSVGAFYTQKSRILAKLRESLAKIPSL